MEAATPVRAVIVNYNGGALLAECVRRVSLSTVPVDIVVVDNASRDGSVERLAVGPAPARRLTVRRNPENLGFARASNLALREWDGEYLLLLNPDCLIEPDTVARMLTVMAEHPEAGMAGCLIRNPDGSEQPGCRRLTPTPLRSLKRVLGGRGFDLAGEPLPPGPVPVDAISGAFMLVRRSAMEQVGLLDEGYFLHCEDLDWCMRFRRAGWQVLFVPQVRVTHHQGTCSRHRPVRVEWHKHRGMARYYRKFFRGAYPLPVLWLADAAIWTRFLVRAIRSGPSAWLHGRGRDDAG